MLGLPVEIQRESEGNRNTHPVPATFIVAWCFAPESQQSHRLYDGKSIVFGVKIVQQLDSLSVHAR